MGASQSSPANDNNNTTNQSRCPIQHDQLNPLNNIPHLPQTPAPGQDISLSLERTHSSIPRGLQPSPGPSSCPVIHSEDRTTANPSDSNNKTWVYPSPQQFYNALVRKGWETPQEAIPVMVEIHNWMNEAVWNEVLRWEASYFSSNTNTNTTANSNKDGPQVSLARFQGRPHDLSPKARFHALRAALFPTRYSPLKPFDRHDWYVVRHSPDQLTRYVIDYYNAGEDAAGNPVFHFDVRPAIDNFPALQARLTEWARLKNNAWVKAPEMGGPEGSKAP